MAQLYALTLLFLVVTAIAGQVTLTLNGAPAVLGNVTMSASTSFAFSNGLLNAAFVAHNGGVQMTAWEVAGVNLAETSEATWYEDWSGGKDGNVAGVDTLRVLRLSADLVELALADTKHPKRRLEQHIVMTADTMGLFTYTVMTIVADGEALNEIRHNVRVDRCLLNFAHNFERPAGQQPTYDYLYTQEKVQDETWRVDARNNASLPCPADNAGDADGQLPAGSVYSKYDWSLYHAETPFFGHYGASKDGKMLAVWLTPLGGVSNATSAATYGVGPQHQDLAIHQDGLILNYFGANHYGLPAFPVPKGYTRFYGPFLHHSTVGAAADPASFFAAAAAVAAANIALANVVHPAVSHPLYPAARSTVRGRVVISDGRSAASIWVGLSTQRAPTLYVVHEPTRFVLTDAAGAFAISGVPPGAYVLYLQAAAGDITDAYVSQGTVVVAGPVVDLGTVSWAPSDAGRTTLWRVGEADRTGAEFALGREPRAWTLPGRVPGDLVFTVGTSVVARDWYYAQTQAGTWTIAFSLPHAQSGTAYLTVSASLTDGDSPAVAVNGDARGITGAMPAGTDSTLSRQAVRSGYPRLSTLTFDASRLVAGANNISFTRGAAGGSNNTGMGYDVIKLQVA